MSEGLVPGAIQEDCRRRFEQAWRAGSPLEIRACLPPEGSPLFLATLAELVHLDLEFRWQHHARAGADSALPRALPSWPVLAVDQYLRDFPVLAEPRMERELRQFEQELRRVYGASSRVERGASGLLETCDFPSKHTDTSWPDLSPAPHPRGHAEHSHDAAVASELIGRYRVRRVVGRGTFGQVLLAWDDQLQRSVAIKIPRRDRVACEADAHEFLAEAQNVARLDHPGIVPIFDVGRGEDGLCYVVSKYVDGMDLEMYRLNERPDVARSARIVRDVARALHHAHQRGLVHRDIKPRNILIDRQHQPAVVDFGLALREEDMAREHEVAGTPAYMSPEQAMGKSRVLDARSDIFSLGVVLYELLAGRRPFVSDSFEELQSCLVDLDIRPPRQWSDRIPAELDRICLKALARKPADRYSTAVDLAEDLERWLRGWERRDTAPGPLSHGTDAAFLHDRDASLPRLDFHAELERLRRGYVARTWVDALVRSWLTEAASPLLLLLGDPGAGKSAFAAHVVWDYPEVVAHHFCIASLDETLSAEKFVLSLAAQLANRYPEINTVWRERQRSDVDAADAGSLFRSLIADFLRSRPAREPLLFVVDGLDESLQGQENSIALLLLERVYDLPPGVFFLVTSRRVPQIVDLYSPFSVVELNAGAADNTHDLSRFVAAQLDHPAVAQRLAARGVGPRQVVDIVTRKAEGNFLYAVQACQSISRGQIDPATETGFPQGLVGIYQNYFAQVFRDRQRFAAVRPVLEVLVASREPLSAEQIASILERDRYDVEEDLQALESFFPVEDGRYRPFHQSICDWLAGSVAQSKTYRVQAPEGHRRIGQWLFGQLQGGRLSRLVLDHLVAHLLEAQCWDEAVDALRSWDFLEAKQRELGIFELVRDFTLALECLPIADERRRQLELLREALLSDLHFLDRYPACLYQSLWNRGWWYDCPQAAGHYLPPPEGWLVAGPPWLGSQPKLYNLLESWRKKSTRFRGSTWLRSLRPPTVHLGTGMLAVLRGHRQQIWSVRCAPDGRRLVSASDDGSIRVWDANSGAELHRLLGHRGGVSSAVFSPNGAMIASGGDDGTVRLWDAWRGGCLKCLTSGSRHAHRVAFSPDGQQVAAALDNGHVVAWNIVTGQEELRIEAHEGPAMGVVYVPGRDALATIGRDGLLALWHATSARHLSSTWTRYGQLQALAAAADGSRLVTAGKRNRIQIWSVPDLTLMQTLEGHEHAVNDVAVSPDGLRLVSGSRDQTVRTWRVRDGVQLRSLRGQGRSISSVAFAPDGKRLYSAGWDRAIRVWSADGGAPLARLLDHDEQVLSLCFSPDGGQLATVAKDGTVRVWDSLMGTQLACFRDHQRWVRFVQYSPDGRWLISAGGDRQIRLWDPGRLAAAGHLAGHSQGVSGLACTPDGRQLASAGTDGVIHIWDLADRAEIGTLAGHERSVWAIAYSNDGRWLASGSRDATVRLWDARDGKQVACWQVDPAGIGSVAFSPGSDQLAAIGNSGIVVVIRFEAPCELQQMDGALPKAERSAWSPEGQQLVIGDGEGRLEVWDVADGRCCRQLIGVDDVATVAAGPGRFPWLAVRQFRGRAGVTVEPHLGGEPIAFYPSLVYRLITHPTGRIWAGASGGHVRLLTLDMD